ncbi:MAG TPA: hypothetical protein VK400_02170 [Pyrinomonadaceae bacterium]|nr:hypothetical protein [Pyrinomonadaceae bacterium]
MNKFVIIVLVVIAVVFFIFVGVGSFGSEPANPDAKTVNQSSGAGILDSLFGGFRETVELPCERKPAAKSSLRCESLLKGNQTVPAAAEPFLPFLEKSAFRTAKIILFDGRARVIYRNLKQKEGIDNPQDFELPKNGSDRESLVITEDGGNLNISCLGNAGCRVGQE